VFDELSAGALSRRFPLPSPSLLRRLGPELLSLDLRLSLPLRLPLSSRRFRLELSLLLSLRLPLPLSLLLLLLLLLLLELELGLLLLLLLLLLEPLLGLDALGGLGLSDLGLSDLGLSGVGFRSSCAFETVAADAPSKSVAANVKTPKLLFLKLDFIRRLLLRRSNG
jgi:hypothetical protein